MYALVRFLRCTPFDEYRVWKVWLSGGSAQVRFGYYSRICCDLGFCVLVSGPDEDPCEKFAFKEDKGAEEPGDGRSDCEASREVKDRAQDKAE